MEQLKFLSNEEVQAMHEATLRVLSEVGVIWTHKPTLDILTDAGCTLNGNRVCFPPDLVMDSIARANKRPCIRGRNGQVNELGGGNVYFHNLGGARDVYDARTGTRHAATNEDCINAVRVLDALPNCHTVTPFFTPPDVTNEMMAMDMFRHALSNTTKPVQGPGIQFGRRDVRMVTFDSFSIGFLNLSRACLSIHTEYLIKILFQKRPYRLKKIIIEGMASRRPPPWRVNLQSP